MVMSALETISRVAENGATINTSGGLRLLVSSADIAKTCEWVAGETLRLIPCERPCLFRITVAGRGEALAISVYSNRSRPLLISDTVDAPHSQPPARLISSSKA